jgi:hypothetical protein
VFLTLRKKKIPVYPCLNVPLVYGYVGNKI